VTAFGDDDPEDAWSVSDTLPELLANLDLRVRWLGLHADELNDAQFAAWLLRFRRHLHAIRVRVVDAVEAIAGEPVERFERGSEP
jgi:hypothetical protein